MSWRCALFISLLAFIGCARPDYITPEDLNNQGLGTPSEECTLRFPNTQTCVQAQWAQAPSTARAGELVLTLSRQFAGGLTALLWMPSMGHGSAPIKIETLGPHQYRLSNLYFVMPGDWDVRLYLKNEMGEIVDQVFISLVVP